MLKKNLITLFLILNLLFSIFAAKLEAADENEKNYLEFVYDAEDGLLLETPYTNVTFIVVAQNANHRIQSEFVMNDCFKPRTVEDCSGSFKLIELPTPYGMIKSLVFERIFPKQSPVIYNLASLGQTYYTKINTSSGEKFIHPFELKINKPV